tara:strand:- start:3520 stop:4794 length:1275 start_codon:yes stop_codon:yes gene_type:complete
MGYGERLAEKILTNPGQEFLSYALGKIIPGKRKLKQEYVGGETLNKFKDWTARHLSRDRGSDFHSYKYAPWGYNYGKSPEDKRNVGADKGQVSLTEQALDPNLGLMNTIGQSQLVKDKHGNVYSYDDYIFGSRGGKSEMDTGGLLKNFLGNKNTQTLENLAQKVLGTNQGQTQYEGYKGGNRGAVPMLQSLGNQESLSQVVNPDSNTGATYNIDSSSIDNLKDITEFIPDFYEKGYYDESGKKRGLIDRAMSKQTAWYPGKLAGKAVGWVGDKIGGLVDEGHPDDLTNEEFQQSVPLNRGGTQIPEKEGWYPGKNIKKLGGLLGGIKDKLTTDRSPIELEMPEVRDIPEELLSERNMPGRLDRPDMSAFRGPIQTATDPRHLARTIDVQNPESVKEFQKATGLTADGILGPKTLAKLREIQGIQ